MKKISIILIVLISLNLFNINYSYGEAKTMSDKEGYELYKERISNFCGEYKTNDSNSETVYLIGKDEQFPDLDKNDSYKSGNDIELARNLYRKNMDDIYACATNIVYYRTLKTIKNELIGKNAELNSEVGKKMDVKIKEIELKISQNSNKCKITSEQNNSIIKKSVLKQTTYQLCEYNFYLEYLKSFNEQVSTLDTEVKNDPDKSTAINTLLKEENKKKQMIQKEITDSYKVFPVVFKAYSEYENNITIHVYLELLREDYMLLREGLHKSINPINQVVYKISNAMKK